VVSTGGGTSVNLTGQSGGSYTYQVQACAGGTCGPETLSGTLGVTPAPPSTTVPSGVIAGTYTVSWASVGATSYNVQESFNGGAWTTLATGTTATSITRPGTVGGTYTYQVLAINIYGSQTWAQSQPVSVTQVPATPTNLSGTVNGNGQLILTWDAMAFATSYDLVEYGTNGSLGEYYYYPSNNSFTMPAPPKGQYKITVSACSIAGCSATAQVGGTNNFGVGSSTSVSTMTYWLNKAEHALDSGTTSAGCTATVCSIVTGSNP
jgi:hypothetical protein